MEKKMNKAAENQAKNQLKKVVRSVLDSEIRTKINAYNQSRISQISKFKNEDLLEAETAISERPTASSDMFDLGVDAKVRKAH